MNRSRRVKRQKGGNIIVQTGKLDELRKFVQSELNRTTETDWRGRVDRKSLELTSKGASGYIFSIPIPIGFVANEKREPVTQLFAKVILLAEEKSSYAANRREMFAENLQDVRKEVETQNFVYEKSLEKFRYPLTVRVVDFFTMPSWTRLAEFGIQSEDAKMGFAVILMPFAGISVDKYLSTNLRIPLKDSEIEKYVDGPEMQELSKHCRVKFAELCALGVFHDDAHWNNFCLQVSDDDPKKIKNVFIIDFGMTKSLQTNVMDQFADIIKKYYNEPKTFEPTDEEFNFLDSFFQYTVMEKILQITRKIPLHYQILTWGLRNVKDRKKFFPTEISDHFSEAEVLRCVGNSCEVSKTAPQYKFDQSLRGNAITTVPVNQFFELQQRVANLETVLQKMTQPPSQKSVYQRFKFWGGKTLKKRRLKKT